MKNSTKASEAVAGKISTLLPFSRCLIGFCAVNETGDAAYVV